MAKKLYISAGDLTSCPSGVYHKKKKTPLPLVHPKIAEIWQLFGRLQEKGQKIQKTITEEWQKKGILISPERFIPWNDFGITGKYDAIVKINGEFILYEIKGGSKMLFDNDLEKPEPYEGHRFQVIIYHHFLKEKFPGLKARILYVERSSGERLEISVEYEEQELFALTEKARKLKEAIEKERPPEPAETVVWNKFRQRHDVSMAAITCKHHALCLEDDHWYEKALEEVNKKNSQKGGE